MSAIEASAVAHRTATERELGPCNLDVKGACDAIHSVPQRLLIPLSVRLCQAVDPAVLKVSEKAQQRHQG
jgi:hypothetical protein